MNEKLYLAGPDVFLPNAVEHAEVQRNLCLKYGFIPIHPMDNNIGDIFNEYRIAMKIQRADCQQVRECDIVVANCNPFRGACMDDGTAYELGYGNALGKKSYGYLGDCRALNRRIISMFPCVEKDGKILDKDGFELTCDFGTKINLMMECGMVHSGGRLVIGDFEDCLNTIRLDHPR
jgi:nucleoside 2-deoxyribosyltransferase